MSPTMTTPSGAILKRQPLPTSARPLGDRTFRFIASTNCRDRDQDTCDPDGFDLTAYRANPIVLLAHDPAQLPIARAKRVYVDDEQRLIADVEFPDQGVSPLSDQVHDLVASGYLRAMSVGFKPLSASPNPFGGQHFDNAELLELSIVSLPSNPEALLMDHGVSKSYAGWMRRHGLRKATPSREDRHPDGGPMFQQERECVNGHRCPRIKPDPCPLAEGCPMGKSLFAQLVVHRREVDHSRGGDWARESVAAHEEMQIRLQRKAAAAAEHWASVRRALLACDPRERPRLRPGVDLPRDIEAGMPADVKALVFGWT